MPPRKSGTAQGKTNVIPRAAEVEGDLRYITRAQYEAAAEKMRRIVATNNLPQTSAEFTVQFEYPAMAPTDANRGLLQTLDAVSRDLGATPVHAQDPAERGAGDISFICEGKIACLDGLGCRRRQRARAGRGHRPRCAAAADQARGAARLPPDALNRCERQPFTASRPLLVVLQRLLDLLARVHHERPVLHDRLADRAAGEQEQSRARRAPAAKLTSSPASAALRAIGSGFARPSPTVAAPS